jgi:hypothetical protein
VVPGAILAFRPLFFCLHISGPWYSDYILILKRLLLTDEAFAGRANKVVRWGLALLFAILAYGYPSARVLYIFSLVLLVTGFLQPKQCTNTTYSKANPNKQKDEL